MMSEAEIAGQLIEALGFAIEDKTGLKVGLVSISVDMLETGDVAYVDARIERQTRTLVFAVAEAFSAGDQRLASATSVHKIVSASA